jgi:hypothetical protein
MPSEDQCVQRGTWLYDGTVKCQVEVWRRSLRPGTGDPEDEPTWRDDQVGEWYEVYYHAPPGGLINRPAGGGYYPDLTAALEAVRLATHNSVRWHDG